MRRRRKRKKSGALQDRQPNIRRSERGKPRLSALLRQADGCLPTAVAVVTVAEDLVFVEGAHFLTRRTRNRLGIAQVAFQGMERGSHLFGDDAPVQMEISYKILGGNVLQALEQRGIQAMTDRPLLFDYEVLGWYLPRSVRINEYYEAFLELIVNEWKINYARKLAIGFGFDDWAGASPTSGQHETIRAAAAAAGLELQQTSIGLRTARALSIYSECLVRIRAQWDKLLKQLVLEKLLGDCQARKKSFDAARARLHSHLDGLETQHQKECLNALDSLAQQTKYLKDWRDDELHHFAQTVYGVLERRSTDASLADMWEAVAVEHNRVREALIAAIGLTVLNNRVSETWLKGRFAAPTRYVDFDDSSDESKHGRLLGSVKRFHRLIESREMADSASKSQSLDQEIAVTRSEIGRLMAELYGLNVRDCE